MEEITVRISELPGADPLSGIELIPLVQNGVTKIRTVQSIILEGGLQEHIDAPDPHPQYAFRVKNNLTATTDPTANDDVTQGYEPTSRWVNTVTEEFFICVTNTAGNANWQQQTLTLDELGSAALVDVGLNPVDVPQNQNLGTAAYKDDGAGNGLNADLLDGQHGSYYRAWANVTGKPSPTITVNGDATGSVTLTELASGTLTLNIVDDSHNHVISNIDGLQSALDSKVESVNGKTTKDIILVTDDIAEDGSPVNLWYTDFRARNAIDVSGDLSYNPTTGVISFSETYSTPAELLTAIKTVDGAGSGLDADLLDGQHASSFAAASHTHNYDNYGGWGLQVGGVGRGTITSGETVNIVGGSNVSLGYSATNNTITVNSSYVNNYLNSLSFDTTTGILTASMNGVSNRSVDLDGRYLQLAGTTFSGEYPITVNASGQIYSHPSIVFNGASGTLTAPNLSGNGASLTNLNGSAITSGTVPESRLPSVLVKNYGNQTIGGIKTFSTAIQITGTSKAAGRFYAGTANPTNTTRLNFDGNLHCTSFQEPSDIRLKEDLVQIKDAVNKVKALNGYTYTMKSTGERKSGVIAQEVLKTLPEVVSGSENEGYSVSYGNMVGLLVEALKEIEERISKIEENMRK